MKLRSLVVSGLLALLGANASADPRTFSFLLSGAAEFPPVDTPARGMEDGMTYVNIHTSTHTAVELRGNLPSVTTPAVPEPETCALMLVGVGAVAALARRRKA